MIDKFILALKGFCMGAADVVPGVSGGTMAFILGIYEQLLAAIRSFDAVWLQHVVKLELKPIVQRPHLGFLIPLALGLMAAVLVFTRVIPLPTLLHTRPEPVYGLFFGLIVGSIVVLLPAVKPFNALSGVWLVLGIILGWLAVNLVPVHTPQTAWFIFIAGAIAICAMILPGISGSFILLILHQYDVVLNGISHFDLTIIIPFGLGAVFGLVAFSRFLGWLLARYHRITLLVIIGVLIGTLWLIWPFQVRKYMIVHLKERLISSTPYWPQSLTEPVIHGLVMMVIGFGIVLLIHQLAQRKPLSTSHDL